MRTPRVHLALHHVVLAVHLGQATFGLDQDHPVHAGCDVLRHQRRGAVVDVEARVERLEGDGLFLTGRDLCVLAATMAAGHRMQVDGVDHLAVAGVDQRQLDRVAHAGAQHRAGHLAVEGPVGEAGAVVELAWQLDGFHAVLQRLGCPRTHGGGDGGRIGGHTDGRRIGCALWHRRRCVERQRGLA